MRSTAFLIAAVVAAGLCACGSMPDSETATVAAADTIGVDAVWMYHVQLSGDRFRNDRGMVANTASERAAVYAAAEAVRAEMCGTDDACNQEALVSIDLRLCAAGHVDGLCLPNWSDNPENYLGQKMGWVNAISRYETEGRALLLFLETKNVSALSMQETLKRMGSLQFELHGDMDHFVGNTSTKLANDAHDRLAAQSAATRSEEHRHLADTRRTISALQEITSRYQRALNAVQSSYGDVAARHSSYRGTEENVFAAVSAIAREASAADLAALADLKQRLATISDQENRTPQLTILDANRVAWELAQMQFAYDAALEPYATFIAERSLPVLDRTSAPRTGMANVVSYAEGRMRRINDAVIAIYDGMRRREAALSLIAADGATRDQLRAVDNAARESEFLNEITARATDLWKTPPTSALNLPLQGERLSTMISFRQLESACRDTSEEAQWRRPGCQKVAAELSKISTYLTQTLPFTLRFGVQKMRTAGFDATLLAEIEAKTNEGELTRAVQLYDAALRAAEQT